MGASVRAFAQSAQKAGFHAIAADQFADWDTQKAADAIPVSDYPHGFLPVARQVGSNYFAYTGGLENYPDLVKQLGNEATLLGNSAESLSKLLDKFELFSWIAEQGFTIPDSIFPQGVVPQPSSTANSPIQLFETHPSEIPSETHPTETDRPLLESLGRGRWVRKNLRSAGGLGIQYVDHPPSLIAELPHDAYLQQWIEGIPCSAAFVAYQQAEERRVALLGFSRQLASNDALNVPGCSYSGSVFPWPLESSRREQILKLGQLLAEEFDLRGLFNIDFVDSDSGFHFLEVNPRYSASMELMERLAPTNLFLIQYLSCTSFANQRDDSFSDSSHAMELLTEQLTAVSRIQSGSTAEARRTESVGKLVWYTEHDAIVEAQFSNQSLALNDASGWPQIADIPAPGTRLLSGHPAFTVFARSPNGEGIDDLLLETAKMFSSRLNSR